MWLRPISLGSPVRQTYTRFLRRAPTSKQPESSTRRHQSVSLNLGSLCLLRAAQELCLLLTSSERVLRGPTELMEQEYSFNWRGRSMVGVISRSRRENSP